jgi:hypothetical protein
MTQGRRSEAAKRPWWKIWWIWAIVGAAVVVGIAGTAGGAVGGGAASPQAESSPAVSTTQVAVPDLTGQTGSDAATALGKLGLVGKYDGGDQTVIAGSNWTVDSTDPAADTQVAPGSTVTIRVHKTETAPAPPTANTQGLTQSTAMLTCESAGSSRYPYGFKPRWIVGNMNSSLTDDQWTFKTLVKIKNQYGVEAQQTMECNVGGSEASPAVTHFLIY